jgi:hypothetical protein
MCVLRRFALVQPHLGCASSDNDLCFWIVPIRPSDCVSTLALRIASYTARVDDINICRAFKRNDREPFFCKRLKDFLSFILVDFATQSCKSGRWHGSKYVFYFLGVAGRESSIEHAAPLKKIWLIRPLFRAMRR